MKPVEQRKPGRKAEVARARGQLKMRDVATMAGVSIATISRVLHNSPLVDPTTAERVRRIIAEANYVPNNTGTSLKSGRSGILGLIIPNLSNPFFADIVAEFERQVVNRQQEMLLAITNHSAENMQRSVERMLMRGVDGVVILDAEIRTRSYEMILHNQVPLVTLNRLTLEPGVSDVVVKATSGMCSAIAHLKKLGHKKIGFLGGRPNHSVAAAREASFREAMNLNKLKVPQGAIVNADFTLEGGETAMQKILADGLDITAVLCANDLSAIGAMRTLTHHGIAIGREFSIVGLDDINLCTIVQPQLTTLRLPRERIVSLYLEALDGVMNSPHAKGRQLFQELELIVRETTGPCPQRKS